MRWFVISLLGAALAMAQQAPTYRDPAGRFSLPLPPGWTVGTAGEMTTITSGATYGLVAVVEGGGADPRRVARFTDQFGQQWKQYKRLQNGNARLGGASGAFAIYSGVNPKGVDAIVKALSAPSGSAAYVLIFSCPMSEWESKKPAIEVIERGFVMGRPDAPSRPAARASSIPAPAGRIDVQSAPPRSPVPPASRELPAGFKVVGRNGAAGQALTASFTGGQSAKATFSGIFKFIAPYFDSPPQLRAAFADARDREVQGFFRAAYNGVPVRGLMVLTVDNGKGYTSLFFDREDVFSQSLAGLARQMTASLPASNGGGASGGTPRKPAPLTQTQLLDGSGYIGLPAGWRITGSFKGVVDAVGPNGETASLGGYQNAFVNPLPGTPPNMMTGPYRPPVPALYLYFDIQSQHALSRGQTRLQILEQAPVPAQSGQAAYISYEIDWKGQAQRGLALVNTSPIDNTTWLFYMSIVQAPKERFAEELPTLWAIWKSWNVNPAVFRERMDAALQSMRDTFRILQESHDNTQRTYDNVNAAWSQVIRGVTTIENVVTQRRADVDTNSVDQVVRGLNEQGYQYRVVPLPELVK